MIRFQTLRAAVAEGAGMLRVLPLHWYSSDENTAVAACEDGEWKLELQLRRIPDHEGMAAGEAVWTNIGKETRCGALRLSWSLSDSGVPRFLVPAMFYAANRFPDCIRVYPGFDADRKQFHDGWSDHWSFGADRCAIPAVFAWQGGTMAALAVEPETEAGMSGVSFSGNEQGTMLGLDLPFREEPGVYVAANFSEPSNSPGWGPVKDSPFAPPMETFATLQPGQSVSFRFWMQFRETRDLHAYRDLMRLLYWILRDEHPLNPWVNLSEARELTAYGLHHWHYHPQHKVFYETILFDRESNFGAEGKGDRCHMHLSWVSGAPYAFALVREGVETGNEEWTRAGSSVLDTVAQGLAPCGLFWAQWTLDEGWNAGWNPQSNWLQARTSAEAAWFLARAFEYAGKCGLSTGHWEQAVRSNLDFAVAHQREDGNFGSYYDSQSGEVMEWNGAAGIAWIPALLAGARILGEPSYRISAIRAGGYYRKFVEDALIYGAPEDIHLTPSSEDGYNALLAFVHLHEDDAEGAWLGTAQQAADWMLTFRWIYNIRWPRHTLLEQYNFRSRGADNASPANNHLHNYGLICLPELQKLAEWTGDEYYSELNRDHLACFLQFIARADGDFNAHRGMMTERYYNTRYNQSKGMILTLSHAWCIGLTLYACQEAQSLVKLRDIGQ